ncbi:hypothetical protein EON63_21450, partial [archaeon]
AAPAQRGSGIHQRLRARAFAFDDGNKRVAFVSVDGGMGSDLVKMRVLDRLNQELGEGIYTTVRLNFGLFLCLCLEVLITLNILYASLSLVS